MPIIKKEQDSKLATQIIRIWSISLNLQLKLMHILIFFLMIMDCNQWYKREKTLQLLPWSLESLLWMNHVVM